MKLMSWGFPLSIVNEKTSDFQLLLVGIVDLLLVHLQRFNMQVRILRKEN